MVRRVLAGQQRVLFRTASGTLALLDAYCPHLGADLGVGGRVVGESLRCPFHGFCFDVAGACVSTPYGGKIPPTAQIASHPVREHHGLLLGWVGSGTPTFEIPALDTTGWTAWHAHAFDLATHPQEIAENSVDVGHLAAVHDYQNVAPLAPLAVDGPQLRARYVFERPRPLFGAARVRAEMDIHQWGLGYALVEVDVVSLGVRTRQLVLATPTTTGRTYLRIAMAVHHIAAPGRVHPLLSLVPGGWLANRMASAAIRQYAGDVAQDVPIWEAKGWTDRPALAEGDGPIGPYRRWAKQFYPVA